MANNVTSPGQRCKDSALRLGELGGETSVEIVQLWLVMALAVMGSGQLEEFVSLQMIIVQRYLGSPVERADIDTTMWPGTVGQPHSYNTHNVWPDSISICQPRNI